MKLTFGKYRGIDIEQLPSNYLNWLADSCSIGEVSKAAADELFKRKNPTLGVTVKIPEQEFMNKLATLLGEMPDKFFGVEMFVKTAKAEYIFKVEKTK